MDHYEQGERETARVTRTELVKTFHILGIRSNYIRASSDKKESKVGAWNVQSDTKGLCEYVLEADSCPNKIKKIKMKPRVERAFHVGIRHKLIPRSQNHQFPNLFLIINCLFLFSLP